MMSTSYRAFSSGVKNRKLLPLDESYLDKTQEIIDENSDKDYYESIYIYNQEHFNKFKKTGSLSGIEGVRTDRLVFDFDSKIISEALQDARELVSRLENIVPKNTLRIFSSGNKGFHVEIHLNQTITRPEFEAIVEHYAGDLKTFDHKIKDEQRLFRYPLTRHNKTNRFKIPLSLTQLNELSIEEMEKLSMVVDHTPFYQILNSYETVDLFVDPATLVKEKKKETPVAQITFSDRPDLSRKPKHLTAAKFALQEGFFEEGERNEACMILASTYKYLGYNQEHTYNIIKATLRMRAQRLGLPEYDRKELWTTIIEPIYSPMWKGGTFTEEDGLLKKTIDRFDLQKVDISDINLVSLNSLADRFKDFATNIDQNTIKTGIDEIDAKVRLTTGSLVVLVAAPSAGKTSISCGVLNTHSNNNEKAVFYSMDMGSDQVFQRIIQKHTGHDEDRVFNNFKNNNEIEIQNYVDILNREYANIKFCFKTSLTPEAVRESLLQEIAMTGRKPKLIVLDYLECIQTGITDPTQSKAVAALKLKDIANEFGICVFLLSQPTKIAGGPAGELNNYTQIKGSGVVGEQASVVLSLSRPGFDPKNPDDDRFATINVLKNRMGKLSSTDLHWDGLTGHIRSLSSEEENDLKVLRKAIAQEKNDKDEGVLY
jgi:KaiC/GvpD/RAD55 family RecA-like ATPase